MDMFDEILQWPPIIQNIISVFIIYVFLNWLPLVGKILTSNFLVLTKKHRLEIRQTELLRYMACESDKDTESIFYFTTLIVGALNNFFKATIAICIGWLLNLLMPGVLSVGVIFALYFLFMAAITIKDTDPKVDAKSKIEELQSEIRELDK